MATPKPQLHPFHVRLQNLEKQRQDRIMSNLRDAVLERIVAATPSSDHVFSDVERRLRQLIPNVYTPSHPPYASMIQRAIEELNDEGGGVSEMAISEFIKREYESLPWAHEGLLRLHLKKQCEMGMLVSLEGGRYNINVVKDGDDVEAETESRRKRQPLRQGRRGRGRWRGRKEEEQINEALEEANERRDKDQLEKALVEADRDEFTDESCDQREEQHSREETHKEKKTQAQHDQKQQKSQLQVQERRRSRRTKVMDHVDIGALALVPCAPHEEQPRRRPRRSKAKNDMDSGTTAEMHRAIELPSEQKPRRGRGRPKATR